MISPGGLNENREKQGFYPEIEITGMFFWGFVLIFRTLVKIRPMKKILCCLISVCLGGFPGISARAQLSEYVVLKTIPVEGAGFWDYLTVEKSTQRLFISHGSQVDVLDLRSELRVGQIQNVPGVHGIALADDLKKGFITAGRLDSVVVFDLLTLEVIAKIPSGKKPDAIIYDPFSKRVFVFNASGKSVTAIDAGTNQVAGTIPLPGKPEYAVTDGKGKIYCNIEDKSTVVRFDAVTLKVEEEWPLAPGEAPTGLAIDLKNNRLFSACSESQQLVVMDASSGQVITSLPIGEDCDGVIFNPREKDVITSNGEGTLTFIHQSGKDQYKVTKTLGTRINARTITWNESNGKMYLPFGEITEVNGKRSIVPGSFGIIVVGK